MTTLVPLGATRWRQSTLHQGPGAPAARTAQRAPARPARPATEPASGRARGGNARTALEDGPARRQTENKSEASGITDWPDPRMRRPLGRDALLPSSKPQCCPQVAPRTRPRVPSPCSPLPLAARTVLGVSPDSPAARHLFF